jgi:hypothetical protein
VNSERSENVCSVVLEVEITLTASRLYRRRYVGRLSLVPFDWAPVTKLILPGCKTLPSSGPASDHYSIRCLAPPCLARQSTEGCKYYPFLLTHHPPVAKTRIELDKKPYRHVMPYARVREESEGGWQRKNDDAHRDVPLSCDEDRRLAKHDVRQSRCSLNLDSSDVTLLFHKNA